MLTRRHHIRRTMLLGALICFVAGTASRAAEPIHIGAISTLTGPGASPDAARGAAAYLDSINAQGGVQGRRIVYVSEDDRANPQAAAAAAQRLLADNSVVALAGGSSVLECTVNAQAYAKARLVSIPGGAVDPLCFNSPYIAPVNAGPYLSLANALTFAQQHLRLEKLCVVSPTLPGMAEAFEAVLQKWAQHAKRSAPPMERFQIGDTLEPVVQRLQARACEAIIFTGPNVVEWVRYARPLLGVTRLIFLTPAYTTSTRLALGADGDGIYAMAEFEPWTSRSLQLNDWRYLMTANKVPLSSLSQGGYLAAQMLVKVLRSIPGPITRESVTRALRSMSAIPSSLAAEPFIVGPAERHNPNRSGLPMQIKDGGWRIAHHEWITFED